MDVTNQVATLQDEVKLLKGEIKSILKEIRTAVLSRDNPFSLGVEAVQMPTNSGGASPPAQEPAVPAAEPALQIPPTPKAAPAPMAPGLAAPTFQVPAMPQMPAPQMPAPQMPAPQMPAPQMPAPQMNAPQMNVPQAPIIIQGGGSPAPAWAGPVPSSQPAPAPFTPSAAPTPLAPRRRQSEPDAASDTSMARQAGPAMNTKRAAAAEDEQPDLEEDDVSYDDVSDDDASDDDASDDDASDNEPIPIRPARGQARRAKEQVRAGKRQVRSAKEQDEPALEQPAPVKERPSWSLSTIAGLAVWAEDALAVLGPRRFQFVLELATFAELLSSDARDVLASLMDTDTLSHEQDRPLNVNECLVVLRQLEAIVHGEKVIKLPRRRGIRHRRIR